MEIDELSRKGCELIKCCKSCNTVLRHSAALLQMQYYCAAILSCDNTELQHTAAAILLCYSATLLHTVLQYCAAIHRAARLSCNILWQETVAILCYIVARQCAATYCAALMQDVVATYNAAMLQHTVQQCCKTHRCTHSHTTTTTNAHFWTSPTKKHS